MRTKVKLTNYETGEAVETYLTQGHFMAASLKMPKGASPMALSLAMAYLDQHQGSKLRGDALADAVAEYFIDWEYLEIDEEAEEAEAPLDGE